jgi:hypothetical protein
MDQSLEQWRPVAGLEDRYEVSDHGRVRSLPRITMRGNIPQRVRGKVIAQRVTSWGHKLITLITGSGRIHVSVHRLVASAFCDRPEGCDVVNHMDNNPANNHYSNLEWTTIAGDNLHMRNQGRAKVPSYRGGGHPSSKHTESQALQVIAALKIKEPHRKIAERLGVTHSFVSEISSGRGWKHLPR